MLASVLDNPATAGCIRNISRFSRVPAQRRYSSIKQSDRRYQRL